jgi:hypothetical protein
MAAVAALYAGLCHLIGSISILNLLFFHKIWKIWKKSKLNSEKIWKIQKKIVK